jgi:hypothetical protein
VLTVGVDLAAEATNTAVARIEWSARGAVLVGCRPAGGRARAGLASHTGPGSRGAGFAVNVSAWHRRSSAVSASGDAVEESEVGAGEDTADAPQVEERPTAVPVAEDRRRDVAATPA